MVPESSVPVHSRAAGLSLVRAYASRVPLAAWVVLGLFLVTALFMALHTAVAAKDSSLRLKVQHSFRGAQLSVWVDGDSVYSTRLVGYTRKKFGLIPDSVQGGTTEILPVRAGKHQVRVRVAADDGSVQEDTVEGEFASKNQRTLAVAARSGNISLTWQGAGTPAPDTGSQTGWWSGYLSTLLLTAAGSIVSALTGYAIKEFPNFLRARQANIPKA
jgi:hypothetical protein